MPEVEPYSNPIAPPDEESGPGVDRRGNLTNEDFRKLMMTPRPAESVGGTTAASSTSQSHPKSLHRSTSHEKSSADEERRKKKKAFYAKVKKEEEERQAEWEKKYRDRAKERRDGANPDYSAVDDVASSTSGYKAVAPDIDPAIVAERRQMVIQESKFLGGDMEHTHLVKGLDYALLQKVRSEIQFRQHEEEEMKLIEKRRERERARREIVEEDVQFKTTMAKNLYRTLFLAQPPERNELFMPGRMAYVFDLEDEYAESDIPTTLIRSKADCPNIESQTTLSTNDIVINKLTRILSYLRQGARMGGKKGKKRDKGKPLIPEEASLPKKPLATDLNIYDDIGDYVFDPKAQNKPTSTTATGPQSYFDKPTADPTESAEDIARTTKKFVKSVGKKFDIQSDQEKKLAEGWAPADFDRIQGQAELLDTGTSAPPAPTMMKKKDNQAGFGGFAAQEHYAECYPGAMEEYDATYDSDDEADFTKMDMGAKKGPVKRWDFETEEEYSKYQSKREALPKAAFQYGVKMSEGRKTRRYGGQNEKAKEKAKLNREWQKISAILEKRKGGSSQGKDETPAKRPKLD